jgi:hypothetical protein
MISAMVVACVLAQAPAAKPAPSPAPAAAKPKKGQAELKAEYQANLDKLSASRSQSRAQSRAYQYAKAAAQAKAYQAWTEQQERMAPIYAAQQAKAAELEIEARKASALQGMAAASQRQTEIDAARLRVQSQALGAPQIMTPQGFVPYPYGIARPLPR